MIEPPSSVLILRFSALGDVVLTAAAVEALKAAWPHARILYAVKVHLAHLVQHNPHVDQVIPLHPKEGIISFTRRLRSLKYSALLDLHAKIRSRLLRLLLPRTPRSIWHKRDFSETVAVKLALRPYHAPMPFANRYHAAVEKLVGRTLPPGRLRYFLGPNDQQIADTALKGAGVELSQPILGLCPGANWQTKRWPAARFGELAERAYRAGLQPVLVGSEEETFLAREAKAASPHAVDLSGRLDLQGLGGFISRCAAFVANDSGPMHLARALGVPTLALFGSTDPAMFDFSGHAYLFAGVSCSPCSFFGRSRCPKRHFRCMLDLDAECAWQALQPLLSGGRRAFVCA